MSGGGFQYIQHQIETAADQLKEILNEDPDYRPSTIRRFREGYMYLKLAQIFLHRIDWLVSADDGEDSFHRRLQEDLNEAETV